jgi:uncharacterized protein YdhG (YjbR/CyaY superfamily)
MSTKQETKGFTADEKAAMKERTKELKAEERAKNDRKAGEEALIEKVREMTKGERAIAEKLHALIGKHAPDLWPKTWYGMPAWALDGDVVCFFQPAEKFKARYSTLGFSDKAMLDDGKMWPSSFALLEITPAVEKEIVALIQKAIR